MESNADCGKIMEGMQQLLEELISALDTHHSLAPQQLLTLLKLFLACRRSSRKDSHESRKDSHESRKDSHESRKDSHESSQLQTQASECSNAAQPRDENVNSCGILASCLSQYHQNKVTMRAALKKEQEHVEKHMNIVTEGVMADIAKEGASARTDGNFASDEENICVNSVRDESIPPPELSEPYREEKVPGEEGRDKEKEEISPELQLIVSVLERCCFLLHTKNRRISLLLLDTIETGCEALVDHENTQLPVLHKIWKPLMLRINDTDSIVMLRSLLLLSRLVLDSGDFLRKRCISELLPLLFQFLINQSIESKDQLSTSGYFFSPQYHAQFKVLGNLLPKLLEGLNLLSEQIIEALNAVCCYLDESQPPSLVTASVDVVKQIAGSHPEVVWVAMGYHMKPFLLHPPPDSTQLAPVKVCVVFQVESWFSDSTLLWSLTLRLIVHF